ncbi:hypothetical protein ACPXCX_51905, partial [Streptomyces sp. DT225]
VLGPGRPRPGLCPYEVADVDAHDGRDAYEGVDSGVHVTELDPVDRLPVDASEFSEPFLREAPLPAGVSDAGADQPSVGEDPLGGWFGRRHRSTVARS